MTYDRKNDLLRLIDSPTGDDEILAIDRTGNDGELVRVPLRSLGKSTEVAPTGSDAAMGLGAWTSLSNRIPTIAGLGDSITAQGFSNDGQNYTKNQRGFLTWAVALSGQRVLLPLANNFGVSSETTAQILARVGSVTAAAPAVCTVLAGTNDIGKLTPSQTIANLGAIYDALASAGIVVIAIPVLPRGSMTATDQGQLSQVNAWIEQQRWSRRGFYIADATLDYGDQSTGGPRSGYAYDGTLHPDAIAAYYIGKRVATILTQLFPSVPQPFANPYDTYNATTNPTGNLFSNGVMAGTSGTLSGTTLPTGSLATGLSCSGSNLPSGTALAFSKTTLSDGRTFQRAAFSGTYNASNPGAIDITTASNLVSSVSAGDVLEGMCEIQVAAGLTNLAQLGLIVSVLSPNGNKFASDLGGNNGFAPPGEAYTAVLRTPRIVVPAGPTFVSIALRTSAKGVASSSTLSAQVDFGSLSLRKIT